MSVTELANLSGLSKSYISQVKNGKCPPSQRLLNAIESSSKQNDKTVNYFALFIQSREAMGVSTATLRYYRERLSKFIRAVDCAKASRAQIQGYLNSIPPNCNGLATRHASFRCIKTYYRWLSTEYGFSNPIVGISAPILGKPILPSLTKEQVITLADNPQFFKKLLKLPHAKIINFLTFIRGWVKDNPDINDDNIIALKVNELFDSVWEKGKNKTKFKKGYRITIDDLQKMEENYGKEGEANG
jgi:transcriptional regulator with XRE-family HTH domain